MNNLQITPEQCDRNFLIRVYPALPGRTGNNSILSYNTARALIGNEKLWQTKLGKAWDAGEDKYVFKLRRGLKFELVAK